MPVTLPGLCSAPPLRSCFSFVFVLYLETLCSTCLPIGGALYWALSAIHLSHRAPGAGDRTAPSPAGLRHNDFVAPQAWHGVKLGT